MLEVEQNYRLCDYDVFCWKLEDEFYFISEYNF